MLRAVDFSHQLIRECLFPGDMAIDATAGHGHDTHFLAQLTGPEGMVFAFDVQGTAITATHQLLSRWGVPPHSWQLLQQGHETMATAIPTHWHGKAGAILFNLGYLPGSDKTIITQPDTTLRAIRAGLDLLRPSGLLIIVLYTGHPGGLEEAAAIHTLATTLPASAWRVVEYRTLNTRLPAPSVIAIQKATPPGPELDYSI